MKILLMGNPNVGKSALFSRLTGVHVVCSNYPNTTVSYCSGMMQYAGKEAELIDVPGTYSLDARNKVEEIAIDFMEHGDVVVNVIDSTNLERNLYLALELIESGKPMVIAANMWDDTKHTGVEIDLPKLEKHLGVPVISTVAVTGEGVKRLVDNLGSARKRKKVKRTEEERWAEIGRIIDDVQVLHHRHHTLLERLEDASIQPLTGLPIAAIVMLLTFSLIISTGNYVIENVLDPFFYNVYGPLVIGLVRSHVPAGLMQEILIGEGEDFVESLGLLTTGIYVPLDMVLPFVILFYFTLGLLEDTGYLPRLATLVDTIMHKIGLHGSAIVPTILGLGCNVPGMLSTRMLESGKQRFIAATLLAICIPCLAQNAVIIGLLLPRGIRYVAIVYMTLTALFILMGYILNKVIPGATPEILMELPPYRIPSIKSVLKKTWMRIRYFLTEAVPYVMLGVLVINLLYIFGIIDALSRSFGPVLMLLFGLPAEAIAALIVGFLRKDVAVGMLAPLGMTAAQLTIACTLLAIYFPCIATYMVLFRELGLKDTLKSTGLMVLVTIVTGLTLKVFLIGF
ncbi:FeoB small GTPase domain-containing protein [Candidatus Altiarchaeota archaeon]